MSSIRSFRPWPRRCITPHEDRGRPGPGRRRTSPAGGGLAEPAGCRSGYSDAPWSSLPTSLAWCPLSLYLSRSWWTSWWPRSSSSILWGPSRSSQCPRSLGHPAFFVRFSVSRRRGNSWWKCLSLSPSATGSAGRRPTGARFDGFEQPRAVKKYWPMISSTPLVSRSLCSSSSTERWRYVVAVVPTVTHSANCAVLGRAGELQR